MDERPIFMSKGRLTTQGKGDVSEASHRGQLVTVPTHHDKLLFWSSSSGGAFSGGGLSLKPPPFTELVKNLAQLPSLPLTLFFPAG